MLRWRGFRRPQDVTVGIDKKPNNYRNSAGGDRLAPSVGIFLHDTITGITATAAAVTEESQQQRNNAMFHELHNIALHCLLAALLGDNGERGTGDKHVCCLRVSIGIAIATGHLFSVH